MSINFIKVLANAKQTILTEIINKRNQALVKLVENNSVMKQQEAYKAKIQKLEDQTDVLKKERDTIGTYQTEENQKITRTLDNSVPHSLLGMWVTSLPNEVVEDIKDAMVSNPAFSNVDAFKDFCGRFDRMMSMATGSKEQRAILLQFYTLDWKGLGIDVPADMDISNIDIKDGRIIADTRLLAAPKKSKK